jgi:DedD protein
LKSQPPCYDDAHDETQFDTEEPVSPERDEPIDDQDHELYEDLAPRSIFAATWFRVVLVVIVLGVVGAVAVPYVLDWIDPPAAPRMAATTTSPLPSTALTPTAPAAAGKPMTDRPLADRPSSETSVADKVADKRDSTLVPAPAVTPAVPLARAALPPSSEATSAGPAAEPKTPAPEAKAEPKHSAMAITEKPVKPSSSKASPDPQPEASKIAPTVVKATTPAADAGGPYWVQIGAFKDAESARRMAAQLREGNFKVAESTKRIGGTSAPSAAATPPPSAGAADRYDVFVSGMSVEEFNRRLAGKGLAAQASGSDGLVVKPSLPLRDAVALSKDLAVDGFKVQVRRASTAASAPTVVSAPSPSPAAGEAEQTLHRVRVGAFADRAAATAAARELESKGFKPYIARGDQ